MPRREFSGDLWGGLAAMLVALPSAMAFGVAIFSPMGASMAAQGALAGILGATALGLVAPAFGGSARLISAPCAPAAAVLAALATGYVQQGVPVQTVWLMLGMVGLLAGGIQIALGFARIGQLIKYIPYPVVSGYLSGVGLIIIGSQIPKLLGVSAPAGLFNVLAWPEFWDVRSLLVGAVVIAVMVLVPRWIRVVPATILALLAGIATYQGLAQLDATLQTTHNNPLLVGTLISSTSALGEGISAHWQSLQNLGMDAVTLVLVPSLTLAVLLSIDTLKTCVVLDAMTNGQHDSNRELVGQGLGNMASSLVGGIPGAGTMGPSLINISSGGKTRVSGLMSGVFSLVAFMALAPLIAWVPVAALAAILMVVGFRMIDRRSLSFFYSEATRLDFLVIVTVILVALFGNLILASGVGVALAILLFIREQSRSSVVRSRIDGTQVFAKHTPVEGHAERVEREGNETVIFELQGSLFFGTANQLHRALEPETTTRKYVILSMRRVQSLDVTATHVLEQIKDRLEEHDAYLVFCDIPKGLPSGLKMKRFLKETGVVRPTEKAFAFRQLDEALEWVAEREAATFPAGEIRTATLVLGELPFLAGQSAEAITALGAVISTRTVKAGKRVFKTGVAGDELFIIRHGLVRIVWPVAKKDDYHLATCGPGEIIGGMAFIELGKHGSDAVALSDVEVYVLARTHFDALLHAHPTLACALLDALSRSLAQRLRDSLQELQKLRN